jgi:hypothetical protein
VLTIQMQAKLFSANTHMSLTIQKSIDTEWLQKEKHILAEKGKKKKARIYNE